MIYLEVFISFFKIGLFSIGGGLAMLPFLQEEVIRHGWLTNQQFIDMIAISESTPGPIGVNMATYVGFKTAGILGAVIGTFGVVVPSVVIIIIIAHWFMKFNEKPLVVSAFCGLRPAVTGLIAAASFEVAKASLFKIQSFLDTNNLINLFEFKTIILFIVILIISRKWQKHPIFYIGISAIIGSILRF